MAPPPGGRPMPKQGDPDSIFCRHCSGPRTRIRGVLFCDGSCDAGQIDGITRRPTWRTS